MTKLTRKVALVTGAAAGIGVFVSKYLKAASSLGGILAAISVIMLIAVGLNCIGYTFLLKKYLERSRTI